MEEIKYLIKNMEHEGKFMHAHEPDMYTMDIGHSIHDGLPDLSSENVEIIRSDSKEFKDLLVQERNRIRQDVVALSDALIDKRLQLAYINEHLGEHHLDGLSKVSLK